jgi:hypothetical protein
MHGINAAVQKVSTVSTDATLTGLKGTAGAKYMTNENNTSENLCRVLFEQMMDNVSGRFATIDDVQIEQSLPFEVEDSINFKLTVSAAPNQHLLTRDATAVASRSYEIRLVVVADGESVKVNTAPAADEA